MPEEPSKILCDADFSVCYDGAHMRSLFGGSSNDSTRKLKSGIRNGDTAPMAVIQLVDYNFDNQLNEQSE